MIEQRMLPARFWLGVVATLIWWSLAMGVYFLALGRIGFGLAFAGIGTVILLLSIATRAPTKLEQRPVLLPSVWIMLAWFTIFTLVELWMVVTTSPTLGIRRTYMAIHEAGLILLVAFTIWQVAAFIRAKK